MSLISRRTACKALAGIWVVPAAGGSVRLQRRAGVRETVEAGQTCLIEESAPGRRVICQLNDTGRYIWKQLATPIKPADLSNQTAAHYGGDPAQVDADCHEFLRRLDELGLVMVAR
ncbi:MAG: PqqD family protein [Acidobacteriota bacterium]